jgi:hypothetical protein
VLRGGCVQEEIMFVIYPECLVGLLLAEFMLNNEAIVIHGLLLLLLLFIIYLFKVVNAFPTTLAMRTRLNGRAHIMTQLIGL